MQYEKSDENESQITPEEYLKKQKSAIRKRAFWFIGFGVLILVFHFVAVFIEALEVRDLFRSIFFILGLFALFGGVWGIYYAAKVTLQDLIPTPEAVEFLRQARDSRAYFSYILVGLIVVVTLFQLKTETVD